MKNMGLHTGADLKRLSHTDLTKKFGKPGGFFYKIVRGIDDRIVQPHRETKSVGAEDTFPYDLLDKEEMYVELDKIATTVHARLQRYQLKGRTITLKIKYGDFRQVTRGQSFASAQDSLEVILETAKQLLNSTELDDVKIRLLGISLSNFGEVSKAVPEDQSDQLKLF
jgi:DNA polymerase-4